MFVGLLRPIRSASVVKHVLKRRYCEGEGQCSPAAPCEPRTQVSILANGVRVATEWSPSPVACMALYAEAGPRFERAHYNGISHFIEHMAFKGFKNMSQAQIECELEAIGAKATSKTSREIQSFSMTFLSEHAAKAVEILTSIIRRLDMNACVIDAAKYNICLEMVDEDNDPRSVTFDYLHQTAFQGTPLSQRVIGPSWNIRNFDGNIAKGYLEQHYQPYKLCLATSGCVEHEALVACAQASLGDMTGAAGCQSDDGPCRFTGSQIIYRDDSMPFAHVAIAFEAPGCTSPDYLTLLLASNIVGRWHKSQGLGEANASPLAQAAALDALCESFESFYIAYRDVGLWGIYFVAEKMNLEDMVERIQNQWMNLCQTTSIADTERGKNLTRLDIARRMDGVVNSCHDIGKQLMYTCSRQSMEDKAHALSLVKQSAVQTCAQSILYDRCPAVVALGPTENLPDYTRIRAGMYWLRL